MAEWRMLQRNARGRLLEQLRADHLEHIGLIHERTLVLRTHDNIDPDVHAGKALRGRAALPLRQQRCIRVRSAAEADAPDSCNSCSRVRSRRPCAALHTPGTRRRGAAHAARRARDLAAAAAAAAARLSAHARALSRYVALLAAFEAAQCHAGYSAYSCYLLREQPLLGISAAAWLGDEGRTVEGLAHCG